MEKNQKKEDESHAQSKKRSDTSSSERSMRSEASACSSLTNVDKYIEVDTKTYAPPALQEKEEEERKARRKARRDDSADENSEEFLPTLFEDVDETLRPIADFDELLYLPALPAVSYFTSVHGTRRKLSEPGDATKKSEKAATPSTTTTPKPTSQIIPDTGQPTDKVAQKEVPRDVSVYIMNLTPTIANNDEVSVDPDYFSAGTPSLTPPSSPVDDITQSTRSLRDSDNENTERSTRESSILERSSYTVINASKTAAKATGKILTKTLVSPMKMVLNVKSKYDESRSDRESRRASAAQNQPPRRRKLRVSFLKSLYRKSDNAKGSQVSRMESAGPITVQTERQGTAGYSRSSSTDKSGRRGSTVSSKCVYAKRIRVDRYGRKIVQYYPQSKK